jgi:hypothetical protein
MPTFLQSKQTQLRDPTPVSGKLEGELQSKLKFPLIWNIFIQ